jgi:TolB-like protein
MTYFRIFLFAAILALSASQSLAQKRVAVLPFRNMDGLIDYNAWALELQDSLFKAITAVDPAPKAFVLIPIDSMEAAVAELNLDPTNPQYESDLWKAMKGLGASHVVQGNFFLQGQRVLMNCYVYDIETKMPHPTFQAKGIVKSPTTYMEAIAPMTKKIYPALVQ